MLLQLLLMPVTTTRRLTESRAEASQEDVDSREEAGRQRLERATVSQLDQLILRTSSSRLRRLLVLSGAHEIVGGTGTQAAAEALRLMMISRSYEQCVLEIFLGFSDRREWADPKDGKRKDGMRGPARKRGVREEERMLREWKKEAGMKN